MKKILSILSVSTILFITSCKKDFNSLQNDPNRATSVPANLILNGVLSDIYQSPFSPTQRWNQFYACNYAYYGDQQYTWSGISYNTYNTLKNVTKMEEEAVKSIAAPNPYTALGKFLRAYMFYNLTMHTGDIPVSEALKSLANIAPKYDSQKEVFKQIFKNIGFTEVIALNEGHSVVFSECSQENFTGIGNGVCFNPIYQTGKKQFQYPDQSHSE